MKVYKTNEIKNISLVGGKGAGKTTLAESILLEGGTISRRGTVDGGNTVSDNSPVGESLETWTTIQQIRRIGGMSEETSHRRVWQKQSIGSH